MVRKFYTLIFIVVWLVIGKASAQSFAEYFDGVTNKAYISPQAASIQNFTVSLWFKAYASGPLFSSSVESTGNTGVGDKRIWIDASGILWVGLYNGGVHTLSSNTNVLDSNCHQVVFMQNNTGFQLYLDGVYEGQSNYISSVVTTAAPFYWVIAHTNMISDWQPQPSSYFFNGFIDELSIWNKDFTAQGVTDTIMNLNYSVSDTNLLWHYSFNDTSSSYAISDGKLADTIYFQNGARPLLLGCSPASTSIITGIIAGNPFCTGSSFNVPYQVTGAVNAGNTFTVQLSDSSGSFNSNTNIGSMSGTNMSGSISVTIPGGTIPGNHYRIRVVASQPNTVGSLSPTYIIISMAVQASVSVSTPADTICSGTTVTFTASPVNISSPSYQWVKDGANVGTNSVTYSNNTLANNDIVYCIITSNEACVTGLPATSDSISMQVNSSLPASVIVSASQTTICQGTRVVFTALAVNGGTTPFYQWKINGVNTGGDSSSFVSSSLDNNDRVTCYMTSNSNCVIAPLTVADSISITVNERAVAGIITSGRDTVCQGTSSKLTVTGSAGPVQWQSKTDTGNFRNIPGADTTTYNLTAPATTYFRIVAGSGDCTDTSGIFTLIVVSSPLAKFTSVMNGKQVSFNSDSTIGAKTYNWNFGDNSPVNNEANPVHTFTVPPDSFYVCLTVYNGSNCSYTYCNYLFFNANGVEEILNQSAINIYPNPASDEIFIANKNNNDVAEIQIINIIGQEVESEIVSQQEGQVIKVNISDLPAGIYEVVLIGNKQSVSRKLIKE